jgi:hypothetical protein
MDHGDDDHDHAAVLVAANGTLLRDDARRGWAAQQGEEEMLLSEEVPVTARGMPNHPNPSAPPLHQVEATPAEQGETGALRRKEEGKQTDDVQHTVPGEEVEEGELGELVEPTEPAVQVVQSVRVVGKPDEQGTFPTPGSSSVHSDDPPEDGERHTSDEDTWYNASFEISDLDFEQQFDHVDDSEAFQRILQQ